MARRKLYLSDAEIRALLHCTATATSSRDMTNAAATRFWKALDRANHKLIVAELKSHPTAIEASV